MLRTLALILAGGDSPALSVLTAERTEAAVPFAGQYRIIAFTLALCDTCLWAGTVVSRCRAPPHWFLDKNGL